MFLFPIVRHGTTPLKDLILINGAKIQEIHTTITIYSYDCFPFHIFSLIFPF